MRIRISTSSAHGREARAIQRLGNPWDFYLRALATTGLFMAVVVGPAEAATFRLMTGVDVGRYPGTTRMIAPQGGIPGPVRDGDRLAGTSDGGGTIVWQGEPNDPPLYPPNHVGAMSFLFRRGSVFIPFTGQYPLMGIDYLGGPLLDLDGNLDNAERRLTPVVGVTPAEIPGASSHVELSFDFGGGAVTIGGFDVTGTNEGGPGIDGDIATVLVTMAGTTPTGGNDGKTNPEYDTRVGSLAPFGGRDGVLTGVYRISGLQVELWYDSILANSGTADTLGSLQHFAGFRGWLVRRMGGTFPSLAGQGIGSTLWPMVDISQVGQSFSTAHGHAGGHATITDGVTGDRFSAAGNGGLPLTDFGGDLGAYFDSVVAPRVPAESDAFVYFESAAFGTNNSGDPIYTDTVSYDLVLIAEGQLAGGVRGDVDGDGDVDVNDAASLTARLLRPELFTPDELSRADVSADGLADGRDIAAFLNTLL